MKITRETEEIKFKPVTIFITLESQEELDDLTKMVGNLSSSEYDKDNVNPQLALRFTQDLYNALKNG